MKKTFLALLVLAALVFLVSCNAKEKAENQLIADGKYHAQICSKDDSYFAYRTTINNDLKPVIRVLAQIKDGEKDRCAFAKAKPLKGKKKETLTLGGSKVNVFDGTDIRVLNQTIFNMTTNKSSSRDVEAFNGDKLRFSFEIPYEPKADFSLIDYAVEFSCFGKIATVFIDDGYSCKDVDNTTYMNFDF